MDIEQDPDEQRIVEPEPEGPRMTRLRGILNKSLVETLKACNFDAICECFPTLADVHPEDLRDAHEKVCEFLSIEVNSEFEEIIRERNIIFKLNGLDRLIADAKSRGMTVGSQTMFDLEPEAAVRARTVPTKEAEVERLRAELERVRLDNRRLGNALSQSKTAQEALKYELLEMYNEFQEGASIATNMPISGMGRLSEAALKQVV